MTLASKLVKGSGEQKHEVVMAYSQCSQYYPNSDKDAMEYENLFGTTKTRSSYTYKRRSQKQQFVLIFFPVFVWTL